MSLALNKPKLDNLAGDIWKSAECVLIKWREHKASAVRAKRPKLTEKELVNLVKDLEIGTAPFSNTTKWTLRRVYEGDHALLEDNFRKSLIHECVTGQRRVGVGACS